MVDILSRRHFKSVFPNDPILPGLSAGLKISAIFRHSDTIRRQFICTLKEDEILYDALHLQMNEIYNNETESNIALRVKRMGLYAARVNGCWKRVRVDQIDCKRNRCSIETVDDGQLMTINSYELFELDPKLFTCEFQRAFGVRFVLPRRSKQDSLMAAGFTDGQKLHNGQLVNIFVLSNHEPFLSLLTKTHVKIQAEKLTGDLDPGNAKLWATTITGEPSRCRGVAFGSYMMAKLPSDIWYDVTIVAFESLEDVQVRGPDQSIRLMYLEEFLESIYDNEEQRDRLTFETSLHIVDGLACVAWDATYQRWIRARVTCTSNDHSVVDVISVDYPLIALHGLKFRDGEIYMLRTDLLFPPLYYSIRAIDTTDKLETSTKSAVAKEVLQIGTHIRVYSPASSTLSFIELANGMGLEEYIEHAVKVNSVHHPGLEQNYPDVIENIDTRLDRLNLTSGRGSHTNVASFSSSMCFPRVLVPQGCRCEPFSHSLSLGSQRRMLPLHLGVNCGSQRRMLPLHLGVSSLRSSVQYPTGIFNNVTANRLLSIPSPVMPVPSSSSSSSSSPLSSQSHFKTPKLLPRPIAEIPQIPRKENSGRTSFSLHKKQRKSSIFSSSTNFENDYLNKSLTSYESDSENETFGKSVRQKQQSKVPSTVMIRPSPPLHNSDSYSENSDPLHVKPVQVEVLSVNCATEIFISTVETKIQYMELRKKLSCIYIADLVPVSGSWCSQNEHYLFWFDGYWNRIKILARDGDEWKVLCVDIGEEKFVKYNSLFYRLPQQVSIEECPPTCLGPLRLSGPMDARWLGIRARIFLRSICDKAQHLTAIFGKGESERDIVLYDEKGSCLNDLFVKFIDKQS